MSDDKSVQCEHGYYGLCPRCHENLRADRDRYSDMLDISQGVVRELRARIAELEAQDAPAAAVPEVIPGTLNALNNLSVLPSKDQT